MLHATQFSYQFPTAEAFEVKGYPDNYQDCLPFLQGQIDTFLRTHQLEALNPACIWDEVEQCFQFLLVVQSKDLSHPHPLSGRTLRVKLKNKEHEIPSEIALQARWKALEETTRFFLEKTCKLNADKVETVLGAIAASPLLQVPPDDVELDLSRKDHQTFVKKKLQARYQTVTDLIEKLKDVGHITPQQFKRWKKHAVDIESEMIVRDTKRDILVSVFAGQEPDAWVSEWSEPLSDLPSTARDGEMSAGKKQLPNLWRVRTILFSTKSNQKSQENLETVQYRSSSFPTIKTKNTKTRREKTQDITEQYLRTVFRDVLIEYYSAQMAVKPRVVLDFNTLPAFDLCVTSLLSPARMPGFGFNRINLEPDKDARQILETQKAYDHFVREGFSLDQTDLDYIARGLGLRETPKELIEKTKNIKPNIVYQNYGSNSGRGFDGAGIEKNLRKKARVEFAKKILKKHIALLGVEKTGAFQDIHESLSAIKSGRINDFSKKSSWGETFLVQLQSLKSQLADHPEYKDLYNDLCLYYRYLSYAHNPYPKKFSLAGRLHNFMPSVLTDALARSLGFKTHINCKSGEDRTGVLRILCILFAEKFKGKNYDDLLDDQKYHNVLRGLWRRFQSRALLSNSIMINGINAPGASGLQVSSSNVPVQQDFIKRQNSTAKTHKGAFKRQASLGKISRSMTFGFSGKKQHPKKSTVPENFYFQTESFLNAYAPKRFSSRISTLFATISGEKDAHKVMMKYFEKNIIKHVDGAKKISQKTLLYEHVTIESQGELSAKKQSIIKRDDKPLVKVSHHDATVFSESMISDLRDIKDRDLFLQLEPIRQALKNKKDKKFHIGKGDPECALKFFIMGKTFGLKPQLDAQLQRAIEESPKMKKTLSEFENLDPKKNRKIILEKAKAFFETSPVNRRMP